MNKKLVLGAMLAILVLTAFVNALPAGPRSITQISSERWPTWAALTDDAMAGNVTQLDFYGSTISRTYQGYFGNITGMIVLGDTQNNTIYDWTIASPQGEIYAVRSATIPVWESVTCAQQWELQEEDIAIGVNETIDEDSVNRTFVVGGAQDQIDRFTTAQLHHPQFWVANNSVAPDSCPLAVMYNETYQPSPYFKEVLLSDNTYTNASNGTGFIIYAGIIAHTINPFAESTGFDNRSHDFQMIVGENGHGADTGTTALVSTYWFYLELD
jgi:hypothetical protein